MNRLEGLPLDDSAGTLLALDFDGTLAPIVEDPSRAFATEAAISALGRLGSVLGAITIITGRPVAQVLELGGFARVAGLERLTIHGQYGAERWDASEGTVRPLDRPPAIAVALDRLPTLLAAAGEPSARIEDKILAVAVHTRELEDGATDRIQPLLRALAEETGLALEPGRQVIELRLKSSDKGIALREAFESSGARCIVFAGDDLGDLPAFDMVDQLRGEGVRGLLVCSASDEQDALLARADIVLDGPEAVASWLTAWAEAVGA